MEIEDMRWTHKPPYMNINNKQIEIITSPYTDLWQKTYYGFINDNAPVLQYETDEKYFSFIVKTEFDSKKRYDQCGIAVYIDSENWLKASIEYENEKYQRLGSVVTNFGYSDWASTDIDASVNTMWFRLSRRESDFRIENSLDGHIFHQMRICHLFKIKGPLPFGIYACSPENSSFRAIFSEMELGDCQWRAHN